jgi:hypothetical protein
MKLRAWAVCPTCLVSYSDTSCPHCTSSDILEPAPPPRFQGGKGEPAGPLERPPPSGAAVGSVTLGALGLVPILGLAFSVLGVVLSLAALRALHRQRRPLWLAYLGLGVSLTTAIPGVLLWGWLQAAAAAW